MGDLFCRAAYGSLFLNGLGRVQGTTLPKISVDEATDFIVHRRRMEAPAQEWAVDTMIITRSVYYCTTRSVSERVAAPDSGPVKRKGVYGVEQLRMKEFQECDIRADLWGRKRLESLLRRAQRRKVCESFRR